MAEISTSKVSTKLRDLLMADDIDVGSDPSYQLCKTIYTHHPMGQKMAEAPTRLAQSQAREISVPGSPGQALKDAFNKKWRDLDIDAAIFNTMRQSRIYGVSSVAALTQDEETGEWDDPAQPLDFPNLWKKKILFNVYDPLNSSGSLVLNQNPLAPDFQKKLNGIRVSGQTFHPSRGHVQMNEDPIYLEFTSSAFGFVGRSVYQRALMPLKSFIQTMVTDDLITVKSGILIATMKQAGAPINERQRTMFGIKRNVVKEAVTGSVIGIGEGEKIETLNLTGIAETYALARNNIVKNTATAADMPARLLDQETLAAGLGGEGTEDAKAIARYIERHREEMRQIYAFFDQIVMYLAWTEEFFQSLKAQYPREMRRTVYATEFMRWQNAFCATWPSILIEPDSEKAKVEKDKLASVVSILVTLLNLADPDTKAKLVQWAMDEVNSLRFLFSTQLDLDPDRIAVWAAEQAELLAKSGEADEQSDNLPSMRPVTVLGR